MYKPRRFNYSRSCRRYACLTLITGLSIFCWLPISSSSNKSTQPGHGQSALAATQLGSDAEKLRSQWQEGALRGAIAKYKEALTIWQSAGNLQEVTKTLENIAAIHFALSEYRESFDLYEQARSVSHAAHDRTGEMRQLVKRAYVEIYLGRPKDALKTALKAQKYFSDAGSDHKQDEAFALNTAGEAYYSLGKLRLCIDYFKRALALSEDINDRAGQALAHLNLGYSYSDSGSLTEARQHMNDALSLYRAIGDRRGEALSQTALGSVHSFIGETQTALDLHKNAMNVLRMLGDHQGEAVALNSIGKVYEDLNELPTAVDNYSEALKLYQELGNQDFEAVTKYYLGRALTTLGKKEQAREYLNQSLEESERVGQQRVAAYALSALSSFYREEGNEQTALKQLRRGFDLYHAVGDRRGQVNTLNAIGRTYHSRKDYQTALRYYQKALPQTRAAADRKGETDTLYNIARANSDAGNLPEARVVLENSLKIIEELRAQVVSPELRASYFASVSDHWELYIDLLMKLHRLHPGRGFAGLAFQASENARTRALIEVLTESGAKIREGVDPNLLEQERSLQQQMAAKAAYQMRLLSGKPNPTGVAETEQEIRRLNIAYQEIQTQVKQQSPRFASLVQPQPLKLEEIQAELQEPDTLLEYSLGKERSYLWLVTRTSVNAYELPAREKVESGAKNLYNLLTARQTFDQNVLDQFQEKAAAADAQYWNEATALSQTLLGPVMSQLASRRLLIVADGALQYLPFEALPVPNAKDVSMIVNNEIVNLPSASVLVTLRRHERTVGQAKGLVAVVADPVFEDDDPRLASSGNATKAKDMNSQSTAVVRTRGFTEGQTDQETKISRLPASRKEAESIIAVTPSGEGKVILDFDACRSAAMNGELGEFRVVHFATHGVINTQQPEMSGILLSMLNEQGQPENGFLQAHDIYNLHLANTELVVLSACRTALGRDIRGEGLVGLTRGFMYAGSKSVVASLWKVDDRATAELMKHFYQGMFQEGLTPAAALRKAKIAMINQSRWHAPYFWAAFTLHGEYRNAIEVPPQGFSAYRLLAVIGGVLALTALAVFARKAVTQRAKPR